MFRNSLDYIGCAVCFWFTTKWLIGIIHSGMICTTLNVFDSLKNERMHIQTVPVQNHGMVLNKRAHNCKSLHREARDQQVLPAFSEEEHSLSLLHFLWRQKCHPTECPREEWRAEVKSIAWQLNSKKSRLYPN